MRKIRNRKKRRLTESQTGNDNGTQPKHPKLSPTQEAGITAAVVDVLTETAQTKPIKFKKNSKESGQKIGIGPDPNRNASSIPSGTR